MKITCSALKVCSVELLTVENVFLPVLTHDTRDVKVFGMNSIHTQAAPNFAADLKRGMPRLNTIDRERAIVRLQAGDSKMRSQMI